MGNVDNIDLSAFDSSQRNGFVDITTNDIEGAIRQLMDLQVSLQGLQVKTPNLDDLFLKLTGNQLGA